MALKEAFCICVFLSVATVTAVSAASDDKLCTCSWDETYQETTFVVPASTQLVACASFCSTAPLGGYARDYGLGCMNDSAAWTGEESKCVVCDMSICPGCDDNQLVWVVNRGRETETRLSALRQGMAQTIPSPTLATGVPYRRAAEKLSYVYRMPAEHTLRWDYLTTFVCSGDCPESAV